VATKGIRRTGSDEHVTDSVQWSKDTETGYYWRITQRHVYNLVDNSTKKSGKPVKSENPYKISTEDDYEYTMSYIGHDGKEVTLYFKEVISN
jgi:hypothetical protein